DRHRHAFLPRRDREPRRAVVERMHAVVAEARALGENHDRIALPHDLDRAADRLPAARAIDHDVPRTPHREPEDRYFLQLMLGHEARLPWHPGTDREDVEEAFVVTYQDVRVHGGPILHPLDF